MCCLIIVMTENAEDVSEETKHNFVQISGDVKPPKVEVKPNIEQASKYVSPGVVPLQAHEVDTARFFSDDIKFQDREELLGWVRCQANKAGFTIVTQRSSLIHPILRLVCERSGAHKVPKKKPKHATTGSRKCGCLFMISGYQSTQTKEWGLNILNGVHNHAMEPALEGHILAGRLKEDDKKIVHDLTKSKMLPRNILIHLKNKRPHCMTNVKQVYNERQKIWKANRGDKKPLQYLISKLEEHNYTYYSRTHGESNTIEDIFWAHPTSVKLFNNFPTVLVMDSTYKTNLYKMPMFEVVGVTSTDLTYSVGFGFLMHEKEENFVWVLKMLRKLLTSKMNMPKVIVTDRDGSLMKAVGIVFPESYGMNCYFHVQANVKQMCVLDCKYPMGKKDGKEVSNRDVVKKIMRAWKDMVESSTQELYANALVEFQDACSDFPPFLAYAMTTLNEVKEKIVRVWTDRVLHLGCRSTNRVESAHALVKKYLDNSVGDLGTCWEKIHNMLLLQHTAIQTAFGQSVTVLEHRFKDVTLYSGLGGHVSRYALDNIAMEESRCRETLCMNKEICGCVQRTSYGLPCACEIATKLLEEKPILLDEIHHHWQRLRMGEESNELGFSVDDELKGIVERLKKLPFQMKLEVKEALRQLAFPETTMMSPPPQKATTKGAKKKVDIARSKGRITSTSRIPSSWEVVDSQNPDSQPSPSPTTSSYKRKKGARLGKAPISPLPPPSRYPKPKAIPVMRPIDYMPRFMLPFIEKVVDVIGDGHCGFRAIAEFMGLTEQNHLMIRTHLIQELKDHRDDYVEVFAGDRKSVV